MAVDISKELPYMTLFQSIDRITKSVEASDPKRSPQRPLDEWLLYHNWKRCYVQRWERNSIAWARFSEIEDRGVGDPGPTH